MQQNNQENQANAENQRNDGAANGGSDQVNTFQRGNRNFNNDYSRGDRRQYDNNNDGEGDGGYFQRRGGRGGRGGRGRGYGGNRGAHSSNNWRYGADDQEDGEGYSRGGRGRGNYRGRSGEYQDRPARDSNWRQDGDGAQRATEEAPPVEGNQERHADPASGEQGAVNDDDGYRGGRGGGRGGFRGQSNHRVGGGWGGDRDEAGGNNYQRGRGRGGWGGNRREDYNDGEDFYSRPSRNRGGRGGWGAGNNGVDDGNDDQPQIASRDVGDQKEPSAPALAPAQNRRVQRAPNLRKNCFDETEILEMFDVHHNQSGISLANYDNIPVEMVPRDIMAVEDFSELCVEPALTANIERCGYKKPTPVQRYGIPVALAGNDLMACAQTGSGKTAAFLIPVVQHILKYGVSPARNRVCYPIALIMAPTRELALQIFDEVRKLTFRTDIFYDVVYGGTPYPTRFENDVLVACPGRLKDIFDRGGLSFSAVKFLILDEADRMLEMGFEEQIEYLVASRYTDMPNVDNRQTLMFSATFPLRILNLAKRFLRKQYYLLTVGRVGSTTKNITQVIEKVEHNEKIDRLFELIFAHKKTDLVLVFVETKKAAEDLHRELKKEHIPSSTIHGDRRQQDRERALADFKSGETPILVATDVASRGLDIPDVSHVIQFDLPSEMDDYVHRIGRTGRAGNKGTATSFYDRNDRSLCLDLYKYFTEHEQEIPSWFRQEAEQVEGEAMLSRANHMGGRRGRRGGGGGGGGDGGGFGGGGRGRREEESDSTWGESAAPRRGGGRGSGGGGGGGGRGRGAAASSSAGAKFGMELDDGGF